MQKVPNGLQKNSNEVWILRPINMPVLQIAVTRARVKAIAEALQRETEDAESFEGVNYEKARDEVLEK